MPFLTLVHLKRLACAKCGTVLAQPGARSFIVDLDGSPVLFDANDLPAEMQAEIRCSHGHATEVFVPNEISAEESLMTPEDAPIAADALLRSGTTESGKPL